MGDKTKKSKKGKQPKAEPSKKSKSKKPTEQPPVQTVQAEPPQPTPEPAKVVVEPIAEAPKPDPEIALMILPTKRSTLKVLAQIGRHIVHHSRNVPDELTITDTTTGKAIASIHENVPLPVIRWIIECAEAIQNNPRMDDIVKRHGMTNVKAFCGYATGLELSKVQLPPKDELKAVRVS